MRHAQTEVLVVGAGPVGLWSALLLAESGIEVTLIDRENRTSARSYACGLHPATLQLLDRVGLAESAINRGRRVDTVSFYEGADRRAEVCLSKLGGDFPFVLILPQSALESLLEERLRAAGVQVFWNHRFEGLKQNEQGISASFEELEGTSTGYIVPHWEIVVKRSAELQCEYLLGADGHNSMVRPRAGLDYRRCGPLQSFAAIEFEIAEPVPPDLRIVLSDDSMSVLWPVHEKTCRWAFQIGRPDGLGDFPEKERRSARVADASADERIRAYVQKLAAQRAPWFRSPPANIHWWTEVSFEKGLAEFGKDRCWLIGDSAHQTGPAGVQSMNAGFAEAWQLANCLKRILREGASPDLLQGYAAEARQTWEVLLGLTGEPKPMPGCDPWIAQRSNRLVSCLPGCGPDLKALAKQIGLELP